MIEAVTLVVLGLLLGVVLVFACVSYGVLCRIELHLNRLVGLVLDSRRERNEEGVE
jgi:hypothetical protein